MLELHPTMGFDCASLREINEVLPITGPQNIIYAQPCKKLEDIKISQARGIDLTVVDSVEEVEKLADGGWAGQVLVRLLVKDGGSKQPFGKKFGAPLEWLDSIYDVAKGYKLNMNGFSFHVGSECESAKQYDTAIGACAAGDKLARKYGYQTEIVDIGGGFVPNEKMFEKVATCVNNARIHYFERKPIRWIAEPGRFFAAPTHTLYTTVIGKKPVWPPPKKSCDPAWRITIDESVYGSFSNIPFDHQKPILQRVRPAQPGETKRSTIVFGRTCDSGDCLGDDLNLHDVSVGDVLKVEDMGAYTTVTATEFNGFPVAQRVYDNEIKA
jgi:ornithine decarboxylase